TYIMMAAVPGEWWFNADGSTNEAPIYVFVDTILNNEIAVIIATLAVLTMISGALAGLLASSRFLFAMARDNLLPTALENVNVKYETPHWPIIITGLLMAVAILQLPVEDVAKLASGFQIMVYILMCGTVFIFRRSNKVHGNYHPTFNSPLYPLMQFWGILAGFYLLYIMGSKGVLGAGIAIIIGTITYFAYGKKHSIDRITPFQTFRTLFANPTPTEHELRVKVFHAADMGEKNHLNFQEFRHAMKTLNFDFTNDELRGIFHFADDDEDGVIDIDAFINAYEAALEEQ
ncbi:MAG: amino acid permease, partial [archaeon]|nr:amino acid permease [archaeon]